MAENRHSDLIKTDSIFIDLHGAGPHYRSLNVELVPGAQHPAKDASLLGDGPAWTKASLSDSVEPRSRQK
jgi:hypothetical protein